MQDLDEFLKAFEPYSKRYFSQKIKTASKYSPLIAQFYRDLADFNTGGKRIRGFLVSLGFRVGGGRDLRKVLPICLAAEVLHSFLLIHDDIVDRSDLRREKPTIHKRYERKFGQHYGVSQAIILGDIACFEALRLVYGSDFSDKQKVEAGNKLLEVLLETGYGEALDIEFSFKKPSFRAIQEMTELKTARYTFVGPLLVGVCLGKVSSRQRAAIGAFGTNVGLAFQIRDDILGVFGDEKTIGKSILSDMREGKNTILIYKARDLANSGQKSRLAKLWGKRDGDSQDIREVREILSASGALAWCVRENRRLIEKSKQHISEITSDRQLGQIFAEIADFVIAREK